MFSSMNSKRWSPASLVLCFMSGIISGLTIWAIDKTDRITFWMFIPMILIFALLIYFAGGEEKEWMVAKNG